MAEGNATNGWGAWEKLVLDKLEKNDKAHEELNSTLIRIHTDLATLKTGARISGAIAGFLAAAATAVVAAFIGK